MHWKVLIAAQSSIRRVWEQGHSLNTHIQDTHTGNREPTLANRISGCSFSAMMGSFFSTHTHTDTLAGTCEATTYEAKVGMRTHTYTERLLGGGIYVGVCVWRSFADFAVNLKANRQNYMANVCM